MSAQKKGRKFEMTPISPHQFYGGDAPRLISKEPKQVIAPLMEWAEKTHWKKGGLAGHKGSTEDPLPKAAKSAFDFFAQMEASSRLPVNFTVAEFSGLKSELKNEWEKIPEESKEKLRKLEEDDAVRFKTDMEDFKKRNPDYEAKQREKEKEKEIKKEKEKEKSGNAQVLGVSRNSKRKMKRIGGKNSRKLKKIKKMEDEWADGDTEESSDDEGDFDMDKMEEDDNVDVENAPKNITKKRNPSRGAKLGYTGTFAFPKSPTKRRRASRKPRKST